MRKLLTVCSAVLALAGAASGARAGAPARPRLVVVLVIDQFRYDFLSRNWDLLDDKSGGFARFKREGAFFTNARYGHATTYTGPGHAHLLTGAYAYQTGMVGNRWLDRASGKTVAIAGDPDSHWLGGTGDESEGTSPRNLIGTTLGDELILDSQSRSKVVSIALKSRSSILLGGKLGKSYWFNEKTGGFVTSTYYAKELPAWVSAWNGRGLADSYFGKSWANALPESALIRASEDGFPFEGDLGGLGRSFPHPITGKLASPGEDFYDALTKTPHGNDLELDFARAALEAEGLGQDEWPDILAVSLSANDEVGHTFGPYSREVLEMTVATDRQLGAFLKWLDSKAPGALVVLTADHGASPIPEYMARLGIEAFRIKKRTLKDAVEKALDERFGPADWVAGLEDPSLYLSDDAVAAKAAGRRHEVEETAAAALEAVPGILQCYTRTALLKGETRGTVLDRATLLAFHPGRSGDVLIVTKPYSFWGKYAEKDYGDSHGSPYEYDTHVPLAFMGPGVAPGVYREPVAMADLAPTLAEALGIHAPPSAEGKALLKALK